MYSKVPTSLTGARISSCLCAPLRALGPAQASIQAASPLIPRLVRRLRFKFSLHHKQQEIKRSNYFPILAAHHFHRPAGAVWRVPRSVGNPAADTVTYVNPSTTLFQKIGVLRGGTPKWRFAHFFAMEKVGRARGHEIPPPLESGTPPQARLPKEAQGHGHSPFTFE